MVGPRPARWRDRTELPGPLSTPGGSWRGRGGESATGGLVGPSTSSIGEDVVMMGGIMASSDAYASRNAVTCEARGRDVAEIPPGSTSSSRDAYASSTLGVRDATEDSCRCCRSRWWGREETEDPCLCCRSRWVGRDEAETALDPPCSCDRRSRLDRRDVREPPTTPGGSIDALEATAGLTVHVL